MNYCIVIGAILITYLFSTECIEDINDDSDDSDPCVGLLENFAYASGNFTYCAIYYGRPIRLCQLCYSKYMKVREVYADINDYDPTGGHFCKDKLFNLDRLQVVDSGFKYVTNLWAKAKCNTCYEPNKNSQEGGEHLIPGVVLMLNISNEFDTCVKDHKNESINKVDPDVCQDCKSFYRKINEQYSVLKGPSGEDDICMDIVDLVNRTRLDWSTTLGCYVYQKKVELIYLIITGLITVIPVAFYFFTWCLISKKQQFISLENNVPDYLKHIHRRLSNAIISR